MTKEVGEIPFAGRASVGESENPPDLTLLFLNISTSRRKSVRALPLSYRHHAGECFRRFYEVMGVNCVVATFSAFFTLAMSKQPYPPNIRSVAVLLEALLELLAQASGCLPYPA